MKRISKKEKAITRIERLITLIKEYGNAFADVDKYDEAVDFAYQLGIITDKMRKEYDDRVQDILDTI